MNSYKSIKNQKVNSIIFLFLLFTIIYVTFWYICISNNTSFNEVIVIFSINIFIYLLGIVLDKKAISLNKIYNYFMLIFMGLAPLCQYCTGYYPWEYQLSDEVYVRTLFFLFLWSFVYLVFWLFLNKSKTKVEGKSNTNRYNFVDKKLLGVFFAFSCAAFLYAVLTIGFSNLLIRGDNHISNDTTFDLVIDFLIRYIPAITLSFYILKRERRFFNIVAIIVLLFFVIILNNPISNSRFNTAAVFFCVFIPIILTSRLYKYRRLFDIIVLIGVIIVFPMMTFFKKYTLNEFLNIGYRYDLASSFNSVDFDAFSFVGRGLQFVDSFGIQRGKQIISTIFFFIPRSILPIKGEITGSLIVNLQTPGMYNNVSCPFMMEIFVDFGYFGMILASLLLCFLFFKLDNGLEQKKDNIYFVLLYSIFYGYQMYLLRGSLASTFIRFMGSILPLIIFFVVKKIYIQILMKKNISLYIKSRG